MPVLRICSADRRSRGQVVLADVGHPVVRNARRDVGVVGDHGDAVVSARVDGRVEGGVVDQTAPDAVRLRGDRGVERRDHLGDDRVGRAGPLIRAAGQGAGVLDAVDRRREERVRRDVVDHHELVLRMAGEDRVVAVALVGRRTGSLLAQDLGQPAVERNAAAATPAYRRRKRRRETSRCSLLTSSCPSDAISLLLFTSVSFRRASVRERTGTFRITSSTFVYNKSR